MQADQQLIFARYRLDLPNAQLWRGNQRIALTSKAVAVLRYLVEHAGQLVSKTALFDALWPGTVVSDGALTFCIVELRKALGDNAKAPRFIETVHGRGYRFLGKVVNGQQEEAKQKAKSKRQKEKTFPQPQLWWDERQNFCNSRAG